MFFQHIPKLETESYCFLIKCTDIYIIKRIIEKNSFPSNKYCFILVHFNVYNLMFIFILLLEKDNIISCHNTDVHNQCTDTNKFTIDKQQ